DGRSTIPPAVHAAHQDTPLCHSVALTSTTRNAPWGDGREGGVGHGYLRGSQEGQRTCHRRYQRYPHLDQWFDKSPVLPAHLPSCSIASNGAEISVRQTGLIIRSNNRRLCRTQA